MKEKKSIFILVPLEKYEHCQPINHDDFETIVNQLNGISRKKAWQPIKVDIVHEDEGKKFLVSDTPWLGSHVLILRKNAAQLIGQLLNQFGELLPLYCEEANLSIFNTTNILDALDEPGSSIVRFSSGRIMAIERYSFIPKLIDNNHVFKIPNFRASPIFVDDEFVQLWKATKLRGLGFNKVWSYDE